MVRYEYAHTGYDINEEGGEDVLTKMNLEETLEIMRLQQDAPGVVEKRQTKREQQDIIGQAKFWKTFPDERAAIAFAEKMIWGDTPWCGRCGGDNVYRVKSGKPMSHRCRDCKKYCSVRTGTVMAETNLPVQTWLFAIYLMLTSRTGVSANQLQKELDIYYEAAWFLCHRIREAMEDRTPFHETTVEIDEAYLGSKKRWMHSNKKKTINNWREIKAVVFGIKDRETGRVMAYPVAYGHDGDADTLLEEVLTRVRPWGEGTTVYTDGHPAYRELNNYGYDHDWVDHGIGEYVDGDVTTNGIESFWTSVKRGHHGTYYFISWKHLHRYINEMAYRQSAGPGNGLETIGGVLKNMRGKRLTYKKLTKGR
ncbi:MAG: IS1595 family transposase [Chloroflexi bacterium]|nr:IS1595 family transposase [Chloroflexota bacterium]MYE41336.1 IS1595 family transposase [Chloroflexota bacterium]